MTAKRLLFLTPQLPYPPHQGTALRNFGLIAGLAQRGHEVALLSFDAGESSHTDRISPLVAVCCRVEMVAVPARSGARRVRDLLAGYTDMARRLWSEDFRSKLREVLHERFDAIHVEGIELAPYLGDIRELTQATATQLIYDAHNAEYALQQRIFEQDRLIPRRWHAAAYSWIQTRRLTRFETDTCCMVDHVLACSEADARALRKLDHRTPITVIRNAIATDDYIAENFMPADLPHPALVFTGKMDFRPNVDAALWFADSILPVVREAIPEARFIIVGKNPHPRLERLRSQPGVLLTGFVPEIQPYLLAADVYVAPLRMGSGTRFKLLEAMAMGRAAVSTRLGAEGLDIVDGENLLLADKAEDFEAAVTQLLNNDGQRSEIGQRAAKLAREQYDWSAVIPILERVYESAEK